MMYKGWVHGWVRRGAGGGGGLTPFERMRNDVGIPPHLTEPQYVHALLGAHYMLVYVCIGEICGKCIIDLYFWGGTVKEFLLLYEKKSKFKPNISVIALSSNAKRVYPLAGGRDQGEGLIVR
jgi:hypothetical protein